jgi:hypothetical protein
MDRPLARDIALWGVLLWLFGYLLGFVFHGNVPDAQLGWYIMPFGIAATVLVLWRWVRLASWTDALLLGIGWTLVAIVLDYLGIVKLLAPPDGYYKLDVYLYYLITLLLPLLAFAVQGRKDATA